MASAENLAQHGVRTIRNGSRKLADQAHDASRQARHYVEREPVNSVLIAAAAGAALALLLTLLARSNMRR
jgi:ElaB/YqjD/DUF883 family membrane-anchored ribosome-binding protein